VTELRFSMEPHDAGVVVGVSGELDIVTSQQFDDYLSQASTDRDLVVLDMSAVDFMDTSALAVIVSHWRRQVEAGGMFLLAGARYRYTKALWITGLADRLPMYADVAEALAAGQPTRRALAHPDEESEQPDNQDDERDPPQDVDRETEPAQDEGEEKNEKDNSHEPIPTFVTPVGTGSEYPAIGGSHLCGPTGLGAPGGHWRAAARRPAPPASPDVRKPAVSAISVWRATGG
jgi:anti-sigma B factor antagonist